MIEISVKNRILKIFFKSVELFQISSEKKWPLIRIICIPFMWYSAHNFIIEAYLWTFEILFNSRNSLGSLITLLRYTPYSKIFVTRYIVILQNCKSFWESGGEEHGEEMETRGVGSMKFSKTGAELRVRDRYYDYHDWNIMQVA